MNLLSALPISNRSGQWEEGRKEERYQSFTRPVPAQQWEEGKRDQFSCPLTAAAGNHRFLSAQAWVTNPWGSLSGFPMTKGLLKDLIIPYFPAISFELRISFYKLSVLLTLNITTTVGSGEDQSHMGYQVGRERRDASCYVKKEVQSFCLCELPSISHSSHPVAQAEPIQAVCIALHKRKR